MLCKVVLFQKLKSEVLSRRAGACQSNKCWVLVVARLPVAEGRATRRAKERRRSKWDILCGHRAPSETVEIYIRPTLDIGSHRVYHGRYPREKNGDLQKHLMGIGCFLYSTALSRSEYPNLNLKRTIRQRSSS